MSDVEQQPFVHFARIVDQIKTARLLRQHKQLGIERAVETFRGRAATDDRDRVFGLLDLLPVDSYADCYIQPDYQASIVEVYAQLVKNCIDSLFMLHMLIGIRRVRPGFPSWIPDLAAFETAGDVGVRSCPYGYYAAWSWGTNAQIHGNRALSVYGIQVDRISAVSEREMIFHESWARAGDIIQSWHDLMVAHGLADETYVAGGTRGEAFIRAVTGELIGTNECIVRRQQLASGWRSKAFWRGVWSLAKTWVSRLLRWTSDEDPLDPIIQRSGPDDWKLFQCWLNRMKALPPNCCDPSDPATDPSFGFTLTIRVRAANAAST